MPLACGVGHNSHLESVPLACGADHNRHLESVPLACSADHNSHLEGVRHLPMSWATAGRDSRPSCLGDVWRRRCFAALRTCSSPVWIDPMISGRRIWWPYSSQLERGTVACGVGHSSKVEGAAIEQAD